MKYRRGRLVHIDCEPSRTSAIEATARKLGAVADAASKVARAVTDIKAARR